MPAEPTTPSIEAAMRRALELAARGEGRVEPNPLVGCVVLRDGRVVGEGYHERFGGPHAEVNALRAAGEAARDATLVVTLEPCCHTGKTPPCVEAVLAAGVARVVTATRDPFPRVDGGGVRALESAGVACEVGVLEAEARQLLAPYLKLVTTGRPWVIAKWAMTLDGRIATRSGDSQWITGEPARAVGHAVRGRVDAIAVGAGTLVADDPLLTARPTGVRTATRVVIADDRPLPAERRLWDSLDAGPVLVAAASDYPDAEADALRSRGVEVLVAPPGGPSEASAAECLLDELGRRRMTNLLVDGGGKLVGRLLDAGLVDEVFAFIAPKIVGGATAPGPVAGLGVERLADVCRLEGVTWQPVGDDLCVRGRVRRDV